MGHASPLMHVLMISEASFLVRKNDMLLLTSKKICTDVSLSRTHLLSTLFFATLERMEKKILHGAAAHLSVIFLLIALGLLLHEIQKGAPIFQIRDIYALRFTHEKFVVLALLCGFYVKTRKNQYAK